MAIWVEDTMHTFVENLFVPAKTMTVEKGEEDIQEAIREGEVEVNDLDASLLPTWKSKAKDQHATYDKHTPNDDFILKTKISATSTYSIFIEVKAGDKTELYEAVVDLAKEKVFSFKSKEGSILTRAIVELK